MNIIFWSLSTLYIISIIRLSIILPQLFSAANAYLFDYSLKYNDPNSRQIAFIISEYGMKDPFLIFSVLLFSFLGIYILSNPNLKNKYKENYFKILSQSFVISGILIAIFSIWRK